MVFAAIGLKRLAEKERPTVVTFGTFFGAHYAL